MEEWIPALPRPDTACMYGYRARELREHLADVLRCTRHPAESKILVAKGELLLFNSEIPLSRSILFALPLLGHHEIRLDFLGVSPEG
jgi:hypothetical protein